MKFLNLKFVLPVLCVFFLSVALSAQSIVTSTPLQSPKASCTQTIGLTEVQVVYHRPAVKERALWGELIPYNAIWRAGANDNTIIRFSDDVTIEGKALKAGTYGLHMIPTEAAWTVIFSNNSTAWGSYSYNEKEDALRVEVKPLKNGHFHEFLTYDFEELSPKSALCVLNWENKKVGFSVETEVHDIVLEQFRKDLQNKAGWTWRGWNEAATYCLNNDINHQEALKWAGQSVAMNPNQANLITKASLIAKLKGQGDKTKETEVMMASLSQDLSTQAVTWKEWNAAAQFALKQQQFQQAQKWFAQAVKMSPNMTNMMAQADVYEKEGDLEEAKKMRKEALSGGTNAELNAYGYQLLTSGKSAQAIKVFKANVEKNPTDPNVWDSLGEGYFFAGDKENAIKAFKKSLSMDPPDNVRANSMKYLKQMGVKVKNTKA